MRDRTVAQLLVACLEREGVEYLFGIPGEENIHFVDALNGSSIRFILVRHEQGASFMADIYGRLSGRAGVCCATLGPGAINLLLGVADAQTDSTPLVAISATVGRERSYKETHQAVDLVALFRPVTKRADVVPTPAAVPELVRRAFDLAQAERCGAVYLAVPEDIEACAIPDTLVPLPRCRATAGTARQADLETLVEILSAARRPVVLAGGGVARAGEGASRALTRFAERAGLPVATTFHGKGTIDDRHPNALGPMGFMLHDYQNFAFDTADVIVSVGYELQEFAPARMNPDADKRILHLHRFSPDTDTHYLPEVQAIGDIAEALERLADMVPPRAAIAAADMRIRALHRAELDRGAQDASFPLKPQRVVADIRAALDDTDIVLADTGAIKMWMARLYPTHRPNTCLVSNALSTMGFALPGALGAKLARPSAKVLAVMGDGSFLMNSQELETAVRERIALVALVWVDESYGLIRWKMELELGRSSHVAFTNPDLPAYAASFGARGYAIRSAGDLLPTLRTALADDAVSVIACPIDYSENTRLTDALGALTAAL
ncbi:MAG TPA: acetolactate synthase large subunit [Candidatus Dormibacteraeota bacterium]